METRPLTRIEHTYVNVRKKNASLENSLNDQNVNRLPKRRVGVYVVRNRNSTKFTFYGANRKLIKVFSGKLSSLEL